MPQREMESVDANGLMCDYCNRDGGFTKNQNEEIPGQEVICDVCWPHVRDVLVFRGFLPQRGKL